MGANGSNLVSKATVDKSLKRFTAWGKEEIMSMRVRHFHDLGGRFALAPRQFAALLDTSENEARGIFHNTFDTDRNGLVDALEVLASMAMLSCMAIKDKIDFVYSLYDFNSSGDITIDEMTIMLRTVASGCGKLDKSIKAPEVKEIEDLTKWAFLKADKDADGELAKYEFDAFCMSNPTTKTFLEYWADGSNQVVLRRGEIWKDPLFAPDGASIYRVVRDAPAGMIPASIVSWMRPEELCPGEPKLYGDGSQGLTARELRKGQLANQWFINALALVASQRSVLRSVFVASGQEKHGRYCIRFFKEERWVNVSIDDYLPCDPLGRPLFARSPDPNEIWAMLIEKAYAKLHECYENLVYGTIQYALRDLTGGTVEKVDLNSKKWEGEVVTDRVWERLQDWGDAEKEYMLGGCWTVPNEAAAGRTGGVGTFDGVEYGMLYPVIATAQVKQIRLLKLRCPWGAKGLFTGDWSADSPLWGTASPQLMELTRFDPNEKGVSWISYDDFIRIFDKLYVVKLHDTAKGWTHQFRTVSFPTQGGGSPEVPSWVLNPQYYLDVPDTVDVNISLTQKDSKYHGRLGSNAGLGVLVHRWDYGADITQVRQIETLEYNNLIGISEPFEVDRQTTLQVKLDAGKYVIIPMTFLPDAGVNAYMSVFCKSGLYPIKLYSETEIALDDPTHVLELGINKLKSEAQLGEIDDAFDIESSNETVAEAALSELISKMWTIMKTLQIRKDDLERNVKYLEEKKEEEDARIAALEEAEA